MDARTVATAADALDAFAPYFADRSIEKIVVLHLDTERRLLGMGAYPGSVDRVALPLKAIIGEALRLDAGGMIVAHNHPSGTAEPSAEDVAATQLLARTARAVGIRLHDHLIFAEGGQASFRDLGLL